MLEISTRQFRLEEDDDPAIYPICIKTISGYIPGTLRGYNGDYRAEFAAKVI